MLLGLTNVEVKEALKKNEDKMTIRFHTCLILIKDIERIVKDAIEEWKGIYHLHNPSDHPSEIKDDEEDDNDDEEVEEGNDSITMDVIDEDLEELMKDKEEEMEEEAKEEDKEEDDLVKIAVVVIASLPHSPPKRVTSSRLESASAGLIASTSNLSSAPSTS